jgi:hypothetical protein
VATQAPLLIRQALVRAKAPRRLRKKADVVDADFEVVDDDKKK